MDKLSQISTGFNARWFRIHARNHSKNHLLKMMHSANITCGDGTTFLYSTVCYRGIKGTTVAEFIVNRCILAYHWLSLLTCPVTELVQHAQESDFWRKPNETSVSRVAQLSQYWEHISGPISTILSIYVMVLVICSLVLVIAEKGQWHECFLRTNFRHMSSIGACQLCLYSQKRRHRHFRFISCQLDRILVF